MTAGNAPMAAGAAGVHGDTGHIAGIPVRNLWLLMFYASDLFRQRDQAGLSAVEDNPDEIPDLVAEMLCHQVERRISRNLSHGYQPRAAALGRVRGRIDLLDTTRRRLLDRGRVSCRFDELTVDTPRNRLVRAALTRIAGLIRLYPLAHRCRSLAVSLGRMGVGAQDADRRAFSVDRFGRHDAADRPMVAAAHLALELALPTEAAGNRYVCVPDREIHWIRRLYEKAIAGFYEVTLSSQGWRVQVGKTFEWPVAAESSGIRRILPTMRTDIVLDHPDDGRRLVIDTKFNAVLTPGWYREATLRSGYLYQIYAYLRSQAENGGPLAASASGLLLHPAVGERVDEWVVVQGHAIRFATVDLGATTGEIRAQLLGVLEFPSTLRPTSP